jgi:putative endonuclease
MLNMKPDNRTKKRKLGDIGEGIACEFLKKHGFEVMERNYLRKWGEIDIVARKAGIMRFVEVKSVSCRTCDLQVSSETGSKYRPEDNMHPWKLRRLARTIQTYMFHKKLDCDFQLDLVTVQMDMQTRQARVEMIENIVI